MKKINVFLTLSKTDIKTEPGDYVDHKRTVLSS